MRMIIHNLSNHYDNLIMIKVMVNKRMMMIINKKIIEIIIIITKTVVMLVLGLTSRHEEMVG